METEPEYNEDNEIELDSSPLPAERDPHYVQREDRILEYRQEAVALPNPLDSVLGCNVSDLSFMHASVMEYLDPRLRHGISSDEKFISLLPAMNAVSRLYKQQFAYAKLQKQRTSAGKRLERGPDPTPDDDSPDVN